MCSFSKTGHNYLIFKISYILNLPSASCYVNKLNGFNRKRFLNAYQSTYGESFTELLDKSKQWYKDQLTLAA